MSFNSRTLFKTNFFSLIVLVLSFMTISQSANAVETITAVLDVPGMTCNFCPITIRKALEKVPGVVEVKAEFETKTATVTFDPAITNIEKLTTATANAGYPSTEKK